MVSRELVELIYEAAGIQRWNDHIRPHKGFTELDKQAHKMVFAYVLARFEESEKGVSIDWRRLIEGGIFEFMHRVVLTDIKPPVFHRLMAEKGDRLNQWVLGRLQERVPSPWPGFYESFAGYVAAPAREPEKRILKASHYLATSWEFKIIYHLNTGLYGLEETKAKIGDELEEHFELAGVRKLQLGRKTANFMDLVGQLRFQQRWAQTPRVPETSVMGHMLAVAMLSYFFSVTLSACSRRAYNNYFCGLFHDLPEVLTRDIVSPVKKSVEGLDELIKDIEQRQLEEKLLPLLPVSWHREIKYFTGNEFANRAVVDGKIIFVGSEGMNAYNEDRFSPVDGELIEVCDRLAALVEAHLSLSHGIRSHHLAEGHRKLYHDCRARRPAGLDLCPLFDSFRP
jgi:putative hydrolase of HD superfamily